MVISDRSVASVPKEEQRYLLRTMMLIRRFEEKAAEMYARGRIKGFLHLYIGEEAIATGVLSKLSPTDYIYTPYRDHGYAIVRGTDSKAVMAELFGKASGASGGIGGSMHIFDAPRRFMGGYAIVAGHMPLACGTAMAAKRLGTKDVVLCVFGDGAVNEGAFHEALNLAAVWKLPVLFLLENNFYGMGTQVNRVCATPEIYKHAAAYGIRSVQVDGMDVIEMQKRTEEALESIRGGEGPYFMEAITYRYRGHSMADPELYRDKSEVEHWRALDPIKTFSEALLASGRWQQDEFDAIGRSVEEEIEAAAAFAEESPPPGLETLMDNVYAPSPLDHLTEEMRGAFRA